MKKHFPISACVLSVVCLFASCNQQNSMADSAAAAETMAKDSVTENMTTTVDADTISKTTDTTTKIGNVPLRLMVDNLKTSAGEIEVGVYTTKNKFPDENDEFKKLRFKPKHGKIDVMIKDLPYGELAFAIYHDVNNNGKIDKNAIGIPKERYAFSNNIKPTIKAPSFDDCKFSYSEKSSTVKISLLK